VTVVEKGDSGRFWGDSWRGGEGVYPDHGELGDNFLDNLKFLVDTLLGVHPSISLGLISNKLDAPIKYTAAAAGGGGGGGEKKEEAKVTVRFFLFSLNKWKRGPPILIGQLHDIVIVHE